jgi:hypothetical protein
MSDNKRFMITLSPETKAKWEAYATKLDMSLSSLIRVAVNAYIKDEERDSSVNMDSMVILKELQIMRKEYSDKFALLQPEPKVSKDDDEVRAQILGLLEDHKEGLTPAKLSQYSRIKREILLDYLKDLQDKNLILWDKLKVKLA